MTSFQTIETKEQIEDSESINSDESEETIVDEDEYDRRRTAIQNDLRELEILFAKLKDALIFERQVLVEQKLREIEDETAEEFTSPLQKLKQNMEVRINLAELLKDYKSKNLDHTFQYEETSIKKTLENDKQNLYDTYVAKLEHEIKEMEEKRRQFLLDYNLFHLESNRSIKNSKNDDEEMNLEINVNFNSEKMNSNISPNSVAGELINENLTLEDLAKKSQKSKKSPKSNQNNNANKNSTSPINFHGSPFIVYSLQDYDILEDWSIIKMHMNLNKISSK